jgi:hypothetical protein
MLSKTSVRHDELGSLTKVAVLCILGVMAEVGHAVGAATTESKPHRRVQCWRSHSPQFGLCVRRIECRAQADVRNYICDNAARASVAATAGNVMELANDLSHDETLQWINAHKAWRLVRKTKPIWVRQLEPDEVGKEFRTADHVKQIGRIGHALCVGVAGEPWFQEWEKLHAKYDAGDEMDRSFSFDQSPRSYRIYRPKPDSELWAAQVDDKDIKGFFIKPNYDPERPLYSPAGGYVVKESVDDPYTGVTKDVWLVQRGLFESTYEYAGE